MPNPISEASPNSLDYYFSLDPNDMSDQDIDTIVEEMRRMRDSWESDKPPAPRKKAASKAKEDMGPMLNLDDLQEEQ